MKIMLYFRHMKVKVPQVLAVFGDVFCFRAGEISAVPKIYPNPNSELHFISRHFIFYQNCSVKVKTLD